MFDGQQLGEAILAQVKAFLEGQIAPLKAENEALAARLKQLEDKPPPEMPAPASLDALWSEIRPEAEEIIAEAVSRAVEALPKPKDGEPGADGIGMAGALIDRAGHLRIRMTNGTDHDLGEVVGRDGKRGKDGLGFDDMDVQVLDDDRTIELAFRRGDEEKAFTLKWPTIIDRGVYKAGESYDAGDAVTWGGSLWIAQRATDAKPDTPESGFRLAVKKGRDGKDAK